MTDTELLVEATITNCGGRSARTELYNVPVISILLACLNLDMHFHKIKAKQNPSLKFPIMLVSGV